MKLRLQERAAKQKELLDKYHAISEHSDIIENGSVEKIETYFIPEGDEFEQAADHYNLLEIAQEYPKLKDKVLEAIKEVMLAELEAIQVNLWAEIEQLESK
jgi:hypothetical protein